MPALAELIAALERAYPPELAEPWDAVGLVCGDPAAQIERVHVCVDPVTETVDEAIDAGAGLLVAHHPLLLRGVHGVPADEPKGALVHRLIRAGVALYCAHTNADAAAPGVSDALAETLGITVTGPLAAHGDGPTGIGRLGRTSQPEPFGAFVSRVAERLPATAWGVRASGDPDRAIRTVAVSGGAGDSYLGLAGRYGVDAYLTADLRHHPAGEHIEVEGNPALIDVAHWASEWPWCAQAAEVIRTRAAGTVDVRVSDLRTDPWTVWRRQE